MDYSYYNNDYYRRKREDADAELRRLGFVDTGYGHYEDPNNVTRTGAYITPDGQICRDM